MADETPTWGNSVTLPEQQGFEQFLEGWIARSSPALVQAARYAALSHSFGPGLLSFLRGTGEGTDALLRQLERAGLVSAVEEERYAFDPTLRRITLRLWWEESVESYRQASARAVEFYRSRQPLSTIEQIEVVYHQFVADEALGLEAFARAFEGAWRARKLGLAERFLEIAREQAPMLGVSTRRWIALYQVRLDLACYQYAGSQEALEALIEPEVEPRLRAEALMTLGSVLVSTQRWQEGLERYQQAQRLYEQFDDHVGAAQTLVAQGKANLDLASSLGGLRAEAESLAPRATVWLRRVAYAPFLAYRWLSRRLAFLPTRYYGHEYQDWIVYRLLHGALQVFELASLSLARVSDQTARPAAALRADVQILLSDLYHRLGQWPRAGQLFEELGDAEPIQADAYRRAALRLAQGRASLAEGAPHRAIDYLVEAREVFERYGDRRALAVAAQLLGDAGVARGDAGRAIAFYAEGIETALAVSDLPAATQIWSALQAVRRRFRLSVAQLSQITALGQQLDVRVYMVRFRGALLERFRKLVTNLAAYLVLPLLYLMMSLVRGLFGQPLFSMLIFAVLDLVFPARGVPVKDTVTAMLTIAIAVLSVIWTHGFFYVLLGRLFVQRLRIGEIARLQTEFVTTFPDGITLRDQDGQLGEWRWPEVTRWVSANRAIWRTPIALFSRLFLVNGKAPTVIDGTARYYTDLQRDIAGRMAESDNGAAYSQCNYSFLRSPWTLVALLLVACMVVVTVLDILDSTCRESNAITFDSRDTSEVYVCSGDGMLHIISVWDDPEIEGSVSVGRQAHDVALAGDYAYVAAGETGLGIVNVSDRSKPSLSGTLALDGEALGVAATRRYAYVAGGAEGLWIVDVRTPTVPIEAGSYDTPGQALDVAVAGRFAYVADGDSGLQIIDVGKPDSPKWKSSYGTSGRAVGVAVAGGYAYIADEGGGLRIVDVRDPSAPARVSEAGTAGDASGVAVTGRVVFVAADEAGLRVFDATRLDSPTPVATLPAIWARSVDVTHGSAYVGDEYGRLLLIDANRPCEAVEQIGELAIPGKASNVTARQASGLPQTTVAYEVGFWAWLFLPMIGLLRLLYSRAALRRALGQTRGLRIDLRADWPLLAALAAIIAWTGFDVWLLTV